MAAIRGRIAQRFVAAAEDERGGLLAALVLGSAQVSVPDALRESARVAGLSHALAASDFHLSVLLGPPLRSPVDAVVLFVWCSRDPPCCCSCSWQDRNHRWCGQS